MLCHVAIARTDVSEQRSASIIRVTGFNEQGQHVPLVMEALCFSETSVLTRDTRHNIQEDGIFHSHCHENIKSYIIPCCLETHLLGVGHWT
jgi:hypothetical protein